MTSRHRRALRALFDVSHLPERYRVAGSALMRFYCLCIVLCLALVALSPLSLGFSALGILLGTTRVLAVFVNAVAFWMARRGRLRASIMFTWSFTLIPLIVNIDHYGGLVMYSCMASMPLVLFSFIYAKREVLLSGVFFTLFFVLVHIWVTSQPDAPIPLYEPYSAILSFTIVMAANTLVTYLASRNTRETLDQIETSIQELDTAREQERLRRAEAEDARTHATLSRKAKQRFLANMSHELRTPLGAVMGYAELIAEELDDLPDDHHRDTIALFIEDTSRIRRASQHLLWLIGDILELSRIEAQRMPTILENTTLAQIVDCARDLLAQRAPTHSPLAFPPQGESLSLRADTERLAQLIAQTALAMGAPSTLLVEAHHDTRRARLCFVPDPSRGELAPELISPSVLQLRELLRDALAALLSIELQPLPEGGWALTLTIQ